MKKSAKISKKLISWKTAGYISNIMLILVVLLLSFQSYIMPYYCRFRFESPVTLHNAKIAFPKGFVYHKGDNSILFHHWENAIPYLSIHKMNLDKISREYLIQFYEKKNFHILETKDISFKGCESFSISYIDSSWRYNKIIYVFPKNLTILYVGIREDYNTFRNIISDIELLPKSGRG